MDLAAFWKNYKFTITFAVLALLISLAYDLVVPQQFHCTNGGWVKAFAHLTSPFNFGCEADLMNIGSWEGAGKVFDNYVLVVALLFFVERIYRVEKWGYFHNFIFSAIAASYIVTIYTLEFAGGVTAGTSIVGISTFLAIIAWALWKGRTAKDKVRTLGYSTLGSFVAAFGVIDYSMQNPFGHALGGIAFLFMMGLCSLKPDWWEEDIRLLKKYFGRK